MTDGTTPGGDRPEELANVHYLPHRPPADPAGQVLDAELISEEEYQQRRPSQKALALQRIEAYRRDVTVVVHVVRTVATHQRTLRVVKALARNVSYPVAGAGMVLRHWRDTHGSARYERLLNDAEQSRDQEALREWEARAVAEKQRRHQRMMDWIDSPARVVKALATAAFSVAALLLALGVILAISREDISQVTGPITAVIDAVAFVVWVATAYGIVLVTGATTGVLVYLWHKGRRHSTWEPEWLHTPEQRAESFAVIDESMLTRALTHCKVTSLTKALKEGQQLEFVVLPRQQGGGTYVQVRLPFGCAASDFLDPKRVELLAGNLGRHKHEVYPQRQPKADARVLDLWVADAGTMDKPAPPWPLQFNGEFDVFRDRLPIGVTMRGEQIEQGMLNRHGLIGAVSKQGKTAFMRLKALGLALDPTVELRIADLKGDGDWSMFEPRAHTLIEGSAVEQTEATCVMLEDLVEEMQRRYEAKRAAGIRGNITRELSRQPGSGFHPIYAFVDEVQVLYAEQHPIGGTKADARAWRAAKRLHDQARAVNIHLYQATQRPDDRTLPVAVREGAHVRASLYVPNHPTAKLVLADAADMGARPQDLRPGRDAGTVVLTGEVDDIPDGMAFVISKSHYVSTQDAYGVIDRAMQILEQHGRTIGHDDADDGEPQRDPLTDIATVIGDLPKMRTQEVLQRLTELHRITYGGWELGDLKQYLTEYHAAPYKTDGKMHVSADLVHTALAERDRSGGADGEQAGVDA
ncbi:hypothetical protein KIPE111705_36935 [Kibdelosporangium persicum]|uniref:Cell division protein FtsK n=1 Tax=Kibdelosporangium persicum TaxID=2698649 RepID=A0ABX2F3I8_9PSEU|nr:hypothetical protein [Kibdelosporangium persicum]NRN65901.1 Cell division protein FtsK [Kibdelosporangium persicum]